MISPKLQKSLQATRPNQQRTYRSDVIAVDALLDGGLTSGHSVEWSGERSCGKTAVLRALVERIRAQGVAVAWVDAANTLMAADWSDTLPGRIWVLKPPTIEDAIFCTEAMLRTQSFGVVVMDGAPALKGNLALRLRRLARQSGTTLVSLRASHRASVQSHVRLHFRARAQPAQSHLEQRQPFTRHLTATRTRTASPASSYSLQLVEHVTSRLVSEATPADRPSTRLTTGHRYNR